MELELKLSDEKDATMGWNFDPACLEKIRDEYRERNGDMQTADIEFIDDILSIVWEAGLLEVDELTQSLSVTEEPNGSAMEKCFSLRR